MQNMEQKLGEILREIAKAMRKRSEDASTDWYCFDGKIGADVTFTGDRLCPSANRRYTPYIAVTLASKGNKLGDITTDNSFDLRHNNRIEVTSPAYKSNDYLITTLETTKKEKVQRRCNYHLEEIADKEEINELKVYHAHKETAAAVIGRIYDAIALSKAKMAAKSPELTKLTKLKILVKAIEFVKESKASTSGREK